MTVSSSTDRATFAGNGVATVFPLPFRFFANSDVQVSLIDDTTGAVTPQSIGTRYTLTGASLPEQDGNADSELTMLTAPATGVSLFVLRVIPLTQPTDIVNQGPFFPEIHENVFDRLTMLLQQGAGSLDRALRVQDYDPVPARLPSVAQRFNKILSFDVDGNPVAIDAAADSSLVLRQDLVDNVDLSKGASMVGRSSVTVTSTADLAETSTGVTGYLDSGGRSGVFRFRSQDLSVEVASDPLQGVYVAPVSDPTGTSGAWVRQYGQGATLTAPLSVAWFGAVGDGSDEIDALEAAHALAGINGSVFYPEVTSYYGISRELVVSYEGQAVEGGGYNAQIRQLTDDTSCVKITAHRVSVCKLHFYLAGSATTSTFKGIGCFATGADDVTIENCWAQNHRVGAFVIRNGTRGKIIGNTAFNSSVDPLVDDNSQAVGDIWLYGNVTDCVVKGNYCFDGAGTGIGIQTTESGIVEKADRNTIEGNTIYNQPSYGIIVYRKDPALHTVHANKVIGNTIYNISGQVINSATGTFTFGAGVYNQGGEGTEIMHNSIANTHTHETTGSVFTETLAPGAIGSLNASNVKIGNNTITSPRWYGICAFDPNTEGLANGLIDIFHNDITVQGSVYKTGIFCKDISSSSICNNKSVGNLAHGILVSQTGAGKSGNHIVGGNDTSNNGANGINVTAAKSVRLIGNVSNINGATGVFVDATYVSASSNFTQNNTARGVQIGATFTQDGSLVSHTATDNGTDGILMGALLKMRDNLSTGNTSNYSGVVDANNLFAINSGTATPNVKNARQCTMAASGTPVTDFTGGSVDQTLYIRATGSRTITHGTPIQLQGSASFNMVSGNVITLTRQGATWYEVSRRT